LAIPQAAYFGLDLEIEPTKPDFFLEEGKRWMLVICDLKSCSVPVIAPAAWCYSSGRNAWHLWVTCCSPGRLAARICRDTVHVPKRVRRRRAATVSREWNASVPAGFPGKIRAANRPGEQHVTHKCHAFFRSNNTTLPGQ